MEKKLILIAYINNNINIVKFLHCLNKYIKMYFIILV